MLTSEDTAALEGLAHAWYAALDTHEPVQTLVDMLDATDLVMVFPEATLSGKDAFIGWYEGVTRIFFDEVHKVQSVTVESENPDGSVEIKVVVRWEASRWNPPSAKSERLVMMAYQSWTVTWTPSKEPKIAKYAVDRIEALPGSASL